MTRGLQHHHAGHCLAAPTLSADSTCCWPNGAPPLIACALAGSTDVAIELLRGGASPNAIGKYGQRALHAAALADNTSLLVALLDAGADPMAMTQDDAHDNLPGGRTPLHAAAASGSQAAAQALLHAAPWCSCVCDRDGCIPSEVAWLNGHQALALELADAAEARRADSEMRAADWPSVQLVDHSDLADSLEKVRGGDVSASDQAYAKMVRKVELRERRRDALCIRARPALRDVHVLRGAWSVDRCAQLLSEARLAAAFHGWTTGRHRHHPTTDLALWRAPIAAAWVRAELASEILPAMGRAFGISPSRLSLREAFVACYRAVDACGQAGLGMHRDGTLLSCSCLLNKRDEFEGGGTCFAQGVSVRDWEQGVWRRSDWRPQEAAATQDDCALGEGGDERYVIDADQGDIVLHSGQQMHGARTITAGVRYVLVSFIDEEYDPDAAEEAAPALATMSEEAMSVQSPAAAPIEPAPGAKAEPANGSWARLSMMRRLNSGSVCADAPASPGLGRRRSLVGFQLAENCPVPERTARFRMPGGKNAFRGPVWRCEEEDAPPTPTPWSVSLSIDGSELLEAAPIEFSPAGDATLRLTTGAAFDLRRSEIRCAVREGDEPAADIHVAPPTLLDEWVEIPGAKLPTASMGVDVAGFTVCFDAATSVLTSEDGETGEESEDNSLSSSAPAPAELRAVRILRHAHRK